MSIYSRWGDQVTIVRLATLEDVKRIDGRQPDKADRMAVENKVYYVVRHDEDDGCKECEGLCHRAYLRADGGSVEIDAALAKVGAA